MKKLLIISGVIGLVLGTSLTSKAQYYFHDNNTFDNPITYEYGASLGFMNCLTDVGGRKGISKKFIKDLNLGKTNVSASVYLNALYKYQFGLRAEATFGKIEGDDKVLEKVKATTFGRYERNLSFRSKITEFSLIAEAHPLFIFFNYDDEYDREPPRFSPYLLGGVGFFSFKPQAQLNGGSQWVDLQPLSTEGQGFLEYPDRKPYKLNQVNIPLGLGVKYELSSQFNVRAEFIYRKLNTDYLDDVSTQYIDPSLYANYFTGAKLTNALLLNDRKSELPNATPTLPGDQRGNPSNNDAYFTFNLKIGYVFGREKIK
jgi:hypothetical protein